jgi:prepilin-type processing-associated H-X9-DG protein
MSNLKQIGLGVMMYVQDYDEKYPLSEPLVTVSPNTYTFWTFLVQPYVKSTQIFVCPSDTSGMNAMEYGSYGASTNVIGVGSISMASITSPASTYMIFDTGQWQISPSLLKNPYAGAYIPGSGDLLGLTSSSCPGVGSYTGTFYNPLIPDCMSGRHLGGVNMAFADGHVKWLTTSTVYNEATKPNYGAFYANQ